MVGLVVAFILKSSSEKGSDKNRGASPIPIKRVTIQVPFAKMGRGWRRFMNPVTAGSHRIGNTVPSNVGHTQSHHRREYDMRSLLEITNKKMWEEYTDPQARRIAEKVYRPIMLVPLIYLVGCAVMFFPRDGSV